MDGCMGSNLCVFNIRRELSLELAERVPRLETDV